MIIQDLEVNVFFFYFQDMQLLDFTPPMTTLSFTVSVDFKTKVYPQFTLQLVWTESFCLTHTHLYQFICNKVTSCDNVYCVLGLKNELRAYKQTSSVIHVLCNCPLLAKNNFPHQDVVCCLQII